MTASERRTTVVTGATRHRGGEDIGIGFNCIGQDELGSCEELVRQWRDIGIIDLLVRHLIQPVPIGS